jgi:hypothetical protein
VLEGLSRGSLSLKLLLEYCDGPFQPTDDDVFRMLPFGIKSLYQAHDNVIRPLYVRVLCDFFIFLLQNGLFFVLPLSSP